MSPLELFTIAIVAFSVIITIALYLDARAKSRREQAEREFEKRWASINEYGRRRWRDAPPRSPGVPLSPRDTSSDRRAADSTPGPADYLTNPLHPASPLHVATYDTGPLCHDSGSSSSYDSGSSSSDSGSCSSD